VKIIYLQVTNKLLMKFAHLTKKGFITIKNPKQEVTISELMELIESIKEKHLDPKNNDLKAFKGAKEFR
jgi:hypothetical protein